MDNIKIVRFDLWCSKCAHEKESETEDPCNECLTTPAREYSSCPLNFKEKEGGTNK